MSSPHRDLRVVTGSHLFRDFIPFLCLPIALNCHSAQTQEEDLRCFRNMADLENKLLVEAVSPSETYRHRQSRVSREYKDASPKV
jgi:hypothetical protein